MATMRAITMAEPGGPAVLRLDEVDRPERLDAEVLVRVVAAGVDPLDVRLRAGRHRLSDPDGRAVVLGHAFSGVVVEAPYAAHPLQPGVEVFGVGMPPRMPGSYAEYLAAPALGVVRKPTSLSHPEAAAVPLAALTAWGMVVDMAKAHDGQRMLIRGGTSAAGHLAVQLAAHLGSHVVAVGTAVEAGWLLDLGAAEVVADGDAAASPVDVTIDLCGEHDEVTSRVRASGYETPPDGATLAIVARLLDARDLWVHVDRVLDLADAAEAHRLVESGAVRGAIVLRVADA